MRVWVILKRKWENKEEKENAEKKKKKKKKKRKTSVSGGDKEIKRGRKGSQVNKWIFNGMLASFIYVPKSNILTDSDR